MTFETIFVQKKYDPSAQPSTAMTSVKLKSRQKCRIVYISLDANTEDERTTDEDTMDGLSETHLCDNKEAKKWLKDEEKPKPLCKKSSKYRDSLSKDLDEDFGDNKLTKLDVKEDKKDIKKFKFDLKSKVLEESFDAHVMPSTSKTEPIKAIINQSLSETSDELPQRSVQMKDNSTDSRYYCRSYNSSANNEGMALTTSDITTTSTTEQKIWSYVCSNCCQINESKKEFLVHFEKIHSKTPDLAKNFKKIEITRLNPQNPMPETISKREHKSNPMLSPLPVPHITSHSSKNRKNVLKQKWKKNSTPSSPLPKPTPISVFTERQSTPVIINNNNHYRVVQKCKICSFTPLVNSMEAIKDHIREEHKHSTGLSLYYTDFLVKLTPK